MQLHNNNMSSKNLFDLAELEALGVPAIAVKIDGALL
jgi:hypothetical protein